MDLPKVGDKYAIERRGIVAVQNYAALHQQIWRETNTGDVGIDGQLEFVNGDGFASGRLLAVQVKAGLSYFNSPTPNGWKFYPEDKHRRYWESFSLPVLIIIHNIESRESYWVDARQALRSPENGDRKFIEMPAVNILENTDPAILFESAGVLEQPFIINIPDVMKSIIVTKSQNSSSPLSYFDLFVYGLTNICRSIYYGTDLIINAVENNLEASGSLEGWGIAEQEHEFTFGFIQFLLAQNLAHIDYADCLIDWIDRGMQPHFVAPLTKRGRNLVEFIQVEEARYIAEEILVDEGGIFVAQEGFFQMDQTSYLRRIPRIHAFQNEFLANSDD